MADTLIKSADGQILYAYHKSQESGDLNQVANNITSEISKALGGLAPSRFSVDDATFMTWGDVKFEKIAASASEYGELKGLIEQNHGLLIATTGDLNTSKQNYRPVYRIIGGDGLAIVIYQSKPRQALVQRLIVAAATLAEKNFDSQARQFLKRDQGSPANDFSKWPEIAFMIRRLALNTTPENANRIVDETFSSASTRKYYSHVWAVLPTSVINHLKIGTYRAADIFGEKTEYPEIRNRIIAQLKVAPTEPFSEFLLYTQGRFSEAVKFNPTSPIHTTLSYALGHSILRQALSNTLPRIVKTSELPLLSDHLNVHYSYRNDYLSVIDDNYKEEPEAEDKYKEETADEKNIALAKKDFFDGYTDYYLTIAYSNNDYKDNEPSLTQYLNYFNQFPERYNSRPIVHKFPKFISLTDATLPQFEEVMKDRKSPHFDDAAYLLGWLAYHRGNLPEALNKFEHGIALMPKNSTQEEDEHLDYPFWAFHQTIRILRTLSPEDAINRIQNSKVLSSHSEAWYETLASFYHSYQYQLVMAVAKQALGNFGIKVESLPVTTDPKRITATFTKMGLADDEALQDIAYLYHASRELGQVQDALSNLDKQTPSSIVPKIKEVVIKYSLLSDSDLEDKPSRRGQKSLHKDIRQSLFVLQRSLDLLPKTEAFSKLREWLHYKRIRLLAQFDPIKVAAANAEFQAEFPQSLLLDDGMAEQIFAEGVIVGDMVRAVGTFDALRQRFPKANAVDNAYSWMAIGWTCAGQPAKAREIDQEIVSRFPFTRHARYARERMQNPATCDRLLELYNWDYEAMRWRERNRIDAIQASIKASDIKPARSNTR